ncbi:MAG: S41 family peptidase [Methylacidiphilales bacterium]|nr:S41 family peptidase [Candidatus Methylacidiphilales bacterium]
MNVTPQFLYLGAFLLLTGLVLGDTSALVPASASPDLLAEALPVLKAGYVDFPGLHYKSGDQLKDLVARSDGGIQLVTPKEKMPLAPIISALLPGNIIYWRLASFTPGKSWDDLAAQLEQGSQQDGQGIILDLRSNVDPDDLTGAAQVAAFFTRNPTSPFIIQGSSVGIVSIIPFHPAHLFRQPIEVIINRETNGAAEALAEYLKRQGAVLIGQSTPGKVAFFAQKSLSSGQVLRYMAGFVRLADGTDFLDHPVVPDIGLAVNDQAEKDVLTLIGQGRVLDVIAESVPRLRLNEAALIRGDDPEEDAELASRENKSPTPPAVIRDIVLVSAIDSLKAIDLSQRRLPVSATVQ